MATISNQKLDIQKGKSSSKVTLSYTICFSNCEVLAGTVYQEKVSLKGDDTFFDDHLTTLRNTCIKASERCIKRSISRSVANKTLNEDNSLFNRTDEVYGLIELTPFQARKTSAKTNIEYDRF